MKYYIMILLAFGLILGGCSKEQASEKPGQAESKAASEPTLKEKRDAFLEYVNEEITKTSELEMKAFVSLDSVTGNNYTDDQTMHDELVNTTIPAYEEAVSEAKKIEPKIKELEPMKEQIVKATETFHEALLMQKEAIEKQDKDLIQQGNEKMMEYKSIIDEYHAGMKELAKKLKVDYQPNAQQ